MGDVDPVDVDELRRAIAATWNVEAAGTDWTRMLQALTERVAYLMAHEYRRLVTAMYTLDVSEERFNAALGSLNPAREIAKLILEREREKIVSRAAHERARKNAPQIDTDIHR